MNFLAGLGGSFGGLFSSFVGFQNAKAQEKANKITAQYTAERLHYVVPGLMIGAVIGVVFHVLAE